eukprot:CAMPEP_0175163852 /NCGR_PEP_ID=MMETSP0087-20121206/26025_1 /TAXON_ID=136419 /ORGANISM="Unknown Unknown, Strain D1" /LENGTH=118 /DNA_ID=CAMNT_0016452693 /DNA_START=314 /DNA_END=667 /DNA_ORIENTATION=-
MTFMFDREQDQYFFAYSFPYTYTDLQKYLHGLESLNRDYFRRELLCRTVQHRRLDLLTISSRDNLAKYPLGRYTNNNDNILKLLNKYATSASSMASLSTITSIIHSTISNHPSSPPNG